MGAKGSVAVGEVRVPAKPVDLFGRVGSVVGGRKVRKHTTNELARELDGERKSTINLLVI